MSFIDPHCHCCCCYWRWYPSHLQHPLCHPNAVLCSTTSNVLHCTHGSKLLHRRQQAGGRAKNEQDHTRSEVGSQQGTVAESRFLLLLVQGQACTGVQANPHGCRPTTHKQSSVHARSEVGW